MITYITTLSIPYLLLCIYIYIHTLQLSIPLESSISSPQTRIKRRREKLIIVSCNERSLDRFYGGRGRGFEVIISILKKLIACPCIIAAYFRSKCLRLWKRQDIIFLEECNKLVLYVESHSTTRFHERRKKCTGIDKNTLKCVSMCSKG